jgi:hypothetical protein
MRSSGRKGATPRFGVFGRVCAGEGAITLDELGATVDDLAGERSDVIEILVDPSAG